MSEAPYDGSAPEESVDLDTERAHGARIYDYILGGEDHFPVDREAGDAALQVWPALRTHMRAGRSFMHRAARFLAAEKGIRQFLDIGSGIPTRPNLHEIAQEAAPGTRTVYVDNDPLVRRHATAMLAAAPESAAAFVQADMREPEKVLSSSQVRETLDLSEPVGLMLISVVHFILDDEEAYRVVQRLVDAMPPGSQVAMTIATDDFDPVALADVSREYEARGEPLRFRPRAGAERFFDGLELAEPGLVQMHKWRPEPGGVEQVRDEDIAMYGGIGRKTRKA